jgi:hypothetical protein
MLGWAMRLTSTPSHSARGIRVLLHSMVLLGLQHHPSYLQCFSCCGILAGVRDEKMLEKLATHDIQDVSALFSLMGKYARAADGRAWHSPAARAGKEESKTNTGAMAQGGGSKNKTMKACGNQSLAEAPTVIAAIVAASGG